MTELQKNTRDEILEILRIFASTQAQQAWEESLPGFVEPIREIICRWQGGYYPHTLGWFREAFSATEKEALSQFDSTFQVAISVKTRSSRTLVEFFSHPKRHQVSSMAQLTLLSIQTDSHLSP